MQEAIALVTGYVGIFVASFLAATMIPLATELFVASSPALGLSLGLVLVAATAGSYLGSVANYYLGRGGATFFCSRFLSAQPDALERARRLYGRFGAPILFFAWVPLIGDPLTVVGGILNVRFAVFTFWVLLGKTLRHAALLGIGVAILNA